MNAGGAVRPLPALPPGDAVARVDHGQESRFIWLGIVWVPAPGAHYAPVTNGDPLQCITADQIPVADNPHGVVVRHLFQTPHVMVSQITLEPDEAVKPHTAPVDVFFYVLEGTPSIDVEGEVVAVAPDTLVPSAAGRIHAIRNESDERVRFLVVKTPNPRA
jgi:quercetin dioxygenase-like cupin family protein